MKEITFTNFDDYLTKADAYDDPKTIKIFDDTVCLTFLRTHLIQWKGKVTVGLVEKLRGHGHFKAIIEDVTPAGRL